RRDGAQLVHLLCGQRAIERDELVALVLAHGAGSSSRHVFPASIAARLAPAPRGSVGSRRRSRRKFAAASSPRAQRRSACENPYRQRRSGRFSTKPHGSTPSKSSATVSEPMATPSSK